MAFRFLLVSVFCYCRCCVSVGKYCLSVLKRNKRAPPTSRAPPRRVSLFGVSFRHRFLHAFVAYCHCSRFRRPFGFHFGTVFRHFGVTFSSIVFTSIFHQFWDVFWRHFWCFLMISQPRTLTLPNLVFWRQYGVFTWFYTSKKHDFPWFSSYIPLPVFALIVDALLHRFWLHFGTLLQFNFMFFGDRFW